MRIINCAVVKKDNESNPSKHTPRACKGKCRNVLHMKRINFIRSELIESCVEKSIIPWIEVKISKLKKNMSNVYIQDLNKPNHLEIYRHLNHRQLGLRTLGLRVVEWTFSWCLGWTIEAESDCSSLDGWADPLESEAKFSFCASSVAFEYGLWVTTFVSWLVFGTSTT